MPQAASGGRMTSRTNAVGLAVVCALAAGIAQVTGSVTGIVTDPSGAAIAGASIELSNPQISYKQVAYTDVRGRYAFVGLTAGTYQLHVQVSGFVAHHHTIAVGS